MPRPRSPLVFRLLSLSVVLAAVVATLFVQLRYRPQATGIWLETLGLLPNFLGGAGVPFVFFLFSADQKQGNCKSFLKFCGYGLLMLAAHELERFTVGHAFDWLDIAASLMGTGLAALFFYVIKALAARF